MKTNTKKINNSYEKIENNFIYFEDIEKNPELLKQIIEESQKEYEEGKYRPIEEYLAEVEAKYHFNEI